MATIRCPACRQLIIRGVPACPRCGASTVELVAERQGNGLKRTARAEGQREFRTLLDRIGGREVVDQAIDVFYERLLADDRVRHFFEGADMDRLRRTQVSFLSFALGGPDLYSGASIRDIHRHLSLTDEHFAAVCEHLEGTLQTLFIPGPLIAEVMSIVNAMHDDVLNA